MELDLASRGPLPEEYRWLLADHPREGWLAHPNMGGHTRFWLDMHASFRQAATQLEALNADYRDERLAANAFKREIAPRLQHFLGALEHHHQMEDHVFFPKFVAAESRVAKGIDLLESDHVAIDAAIHSTVADANALLQAGDRDALLRTGEAYVARANGLTRLMRKHLDDEEEIIMPLILDRGEAALGVE